MNPDLAKERQHASQFPLQEMTEFVYGKELYEIKQRISKIIEKDPILAKQDLIFLSRTDYHNRALQMSMHLHKLKMQYKWNETEFLIAVQIMGESGPTAIHDFVFAFCMREMTTPEQRSKWLPLIENGVVWGTYVQTELGHGSNVQALETTATYLKDSKEFEIHSPTLTSTKWWPGGLGKTVNFGVVFAKLIIDGKTYGIFPFLVQIRSLDNHMPLKGITVGDIGPKFGFNAVDNGFLKFDHIRIPRDQMLMRFAAVTPDGKFMKQGDPVLAYSSMLATRFGLVQSETQRLKRAVTIATRYSAVRRQFGGEHNNGAELQVIDYLTQQYRVFPQLANAYAAGCTSRKLMVHQQELKEALEKKDQAAPLLAELHATSTALKVLVGEVICKGIEDCRLACGGHGYSLLSGLPQLYVDAAPVLTAEGENWILTQQTARSMLKYLQVVAGGKQLPNFSYAKYLEAEVPRLDSKCRAASDADWRNPDIQLEAYGHRATRIAASVAQQMQDMMASGKSANDAWNAVLIDTARLARAHAYYILVFNFVQATSQAEKNQPKLYPYLKRLCDLFALFHIESLMGDFTEDSYLSASQAGAVRRVIKQLLAEIRPDAVLLVDSFAESDYTLNSDIGRYDGNVYQALWDRAQREPLNKSQVAEGYHKYQQPLIKSGLAKLKAKL